MKAFLSFMSASLQDTTKYQSQSEMIISGLLETPHFTHTYLLSYNNNAELFSAPGQGSRAAKLLLDIHRHESESSPRAQDPGDLSEIVPETVSGKDRAFQVSKWNSSSCSPHDPEETSKTRQIPGESAWNTNFLRKTVTHSILASIHVKKYCAQNVVQLLQIQTIQ